MLLFWSRWPKHWQVAQLLCIALYREMQPSLYYSFAWSTVFMPRFLPHSFWDIFKHHLIIIIIYNSVVTTSPWVRPLFIDVFGWTFSDNDQNLMRSTQHAKLQFFEVCTIEIVGLEFVDCGGSSCSCWHCWFYFIDSILISDSGGDATLVLNETAAANIAAVSDVHKSHARGSISGNWGRLAALTMYDSRDTVY